MFDDFFGKLLPSEGFFQHQHFFVKIPLHGFAANQAPKQCLKSKLRTTGMLSTDKVLILLKKYEND